MNLLIVDDEIRAIRAVEKNIHWERLGFEEVFTATSKTRAMEVIEANPVHLLLCDIEMPFGSGLELLEWIHACGLAIKCIFMTCHADFQYAQQALRLGSLDYILKPLDFARLEETLAGAARQLAAPPEAPDAPQEAAKQFWKDFVAGDIAPSLESVQAYWQRRGAAFRVQDRFLPLLASVKQWGADVKPEERKLFLYALRNMAGELFQLPDVRHLVVPLSGDSFLVVFCLPTGSGPGGIEDAVMAASAELARAARHYLRASVCSYIGEAAGLVEVPAQLETLQTMDYNNVTFTMSYLLLRQGKDFYREQQEAGHPHWRELLLNGAYSELLRELSNTVMQDSLRGKVNRAYLEKTNKEFGFLLYEFASTNGTSMDELFGDSWAAQQMANALTSLEGFLQWADHAIALLRRYDVEKHGGAKNPVETIKHYIRAHLEDDLRADTLAAQVNLNPDYLNRLFKREVGVPLNQYVIHLKMSKAKWMMEHSALSISEIAAQVGYFNYSSFNRSFTKEHGMSPQEYKKLLRENV